MKKISIFIVFLCIPLLVNAKEYCKVVSGSGKNLGDEIVCGTEHFYVLSNENDEIKMFAKYNLYTGNIIDRVKIEKEDGDTRTREQFCNDLAAERGLNESIKTDIGNNLQKFYTDENYCFFERPIEVNEMLQNEEATSAHTDSDGNYLYPQVGDNYIRNNRGYFGSNGYSDADLDIPYEVETYIDFNVNLNSSSMLGDKLLKYKESLNKLGFEIVNIDLLSVTELNDIINKVANKQLPLAQWGESVSSLDIVYGPGGSVRENVLVDFGDLKEYIPTKYSWLYSTTYWNRTAYVSRTTFNHYILFTASMGKLCGAGYPYCGSIIELGCGIRPVVTISNKLIAYNIEIESDGNGDIECVDKSSGGEEIIFKTIPKVGYKIKSLIVKSSSGEEITFTEEEIEKNDDGTISLSANKFTMPFEDVIIKANWEKDNFITNVIVNPKTGVIGTAFISAILVVSTAIYILLKQKRSYL